MPVAQTEAPKEVQVSKVVTPGPASSIPAAPPMAESEGSQQAAPLEGKSPIVGSHAATNTNAIPLVICQSQPEPLWQKILGDAPSILFGLTALLISIVSLIHTRNNDKSTRAQSIHDDYWIRKIISPISVEPFLKYATELSASLPEKKATRAQVQDYWTKHAPKMVEYTLSFQVLNLVDRQLGADVVQQLEQFEDRLAEYCGTLGQYLVGGLEVPPNRDQCARDLIETTIKILKLIQKHQASVGSL